MASNDPPAAGGKRPVTPRDAASLVLIRDGKHSPEVLMGRRPASARFMPGVYVFPGGAVEDGDFALRTTHPLPADALSRLRRQADESLSHALAWTAVRETWEETGLMLGIEGAAQGLADCPALRHYTERSQTPDLSRLDYLMRAVTPSYLPIRFNTRFFIADGSSTTGPLQPCSELEAVDWHPIDDALELKIVNVTAMVLDKAWQYWRTRPEPDPDRPTPMFTQCVPDQVVLRDE